MNLLQHIPESKWGPVLCTLNPPFEPKPETIVGRWKVSEQLSFALGESRTDKDITINTVRASSLHGAQRPLPEESP